MGQTELFILNKVIDTSCSFTMCFTDYPLDSGDYSYINPHDYTAPNSELASSSMQLMASENGK